MRAKSILAIGLLLTLAVLSFPQSRETGAIIGKVTDEQKNPLPGVAVTLSSPKLMGARGAVSDAQGAFRFPALPPGEYALKGVLQGFRSVVQENIRLTTTVSLSVDLVMTQAAVSEEMRYNRNLCMKRRSVSYVGSPNSTRTLQGPEGYAHEEDYRKSGRRSNDFGNGDGPGSVDPGGRAENAPVRIGL